jgi:uncharacterized damage-inducible protein DinB
MITPDWCRMMAAYNAEMNRRLYAAAARLTEAQRQEERGAFFGSLDATLSHLVWGDGMWMSRFDGGAKPDAPFPGARGWFADFAAMHAARLATDARIEAWAATVDPAWLAGRLTWMSGATRQQMTRDAWVLVTHMFNHQAHHRGQAHALLTAFGEDTGATDLPFILPLG